MATYRRRLGGTIFLFGIIALTSPTPGSAQTWKKASALPIVAENSACNSASDSAGIAADRSTLLSCRSGFWKKIVSSGGKTTLAGMQSTYCPGTISGTYYDYIIDSACNVYVSYYINRNAGPTISNQYIGNIAGKNQLESVFAFSTGLGAVTLRVQIFPTGAITTGQNYSGGDTYSPMPTEFGGWTS